MVRWLSVLWNNLRKKGILKNTKLHSHSNSSIHLEKSQLILVTAYPLKLQYRLEKSRLILVKNEVYLCTSKVLISKSYILKPFIFILNTCTKMLYPRIKIVRIKINLFLLIPLFFLLRLCLGFLNKSILNVQNR